MIKTGIITAKDIWQGFKRHKINGLICILHEYEDEEEKLKETAKNVEKNFSSILLGASTV